VKFWRADGGRVSMTCGRKAKQLVANPDLQQHVADCSLAPGLQAYGRTRKEKCEDYTRNSSKAAAAVAINCECDRRISGAGRKELKPFWMDAAFRNRKCDVLSMQSSVEAP
jgi:hypothetical protein